MHVIVNGMILHQFPDLQWLKHQAEQKFANHMAWGGRILTVEGWPTVILNAETKSAYRDNIRGPLSLFTNISGESRVSVGNRSVQVKEDFFFLTNADQHYSLEISKPAQTFNIHFGEHFIDKVFASLHYSVEKLIENNFQTPACSIAFHNRLQRHDAVTKKILCQIKEKGEPSTLFLEESLYNLLAHLLSHEEGVTKMTRLLPALKSSTRAELLQRLLISTDYIFSFYDQSLSLEELAQACCLSKFHFLRLFKIVFQKTPYQFINEVRIQKAKELLKGTKLEVHEIAKRIGFEDSSSFSRMFYQGTGAYPSHFR